MKRDIKKLLLGASVVGVITITSGCSMMGMGGMNDGNKDAPSGMMGMGGMMNMMNMMGMGGMDDGNKDAPDRMDEGNKNTPDGMIGIDDSSKKAPTTKANDSEKCGSH